MFPAKIIRGAIVDHLAFRREVAAQVIKNPQCTAGRITGIEHIGIVA